jgi:hypothetical protein
MSAEIFPVFPAGDSTAFTIRRDYRRYVVFHIQPRGEGLHPLVLAEGASFESRHAAVAAAQRQARHHWS